MTEKQFRKILKALNIGKNRSYVEIKELLDVKLNEYLDRQDEEAEKMLSDIQDALDYVEELIDKMSSGIALPSVKQEETGEEINRDMLKQAAKNDKKGAQSFKLDANAGGSTSAGGASQGATAASGVNPKGKPWFYSLYGDKKVDDMFEMAEGDLQQGDFKHAASVFDMILKIEVTNPGAYMGKLLANHQLREPKDIATCHDRGLENESELKRAESTGNAKQKKFIQDALEERQKAEEYLDALRVFSNGSSIRDFQKAESMFTAMGDYRDARSKAEQCHKKIEELKKAEEEQRRRDEERRRQEEKKRLEDERRREEERQRQEKERKEQEKKERINRRIGIVIAAGIMVVICIIFYRSFMTSTYYGTVIYLGTIFNYKEYTIADSVKTIAPNVFEGAEMESIVIPESVEFIGEGAFKDCANLKSIEISQSVQEIDASAFSGCVSLQNVALPNNLQRIGNETFAGCTSLIQAIFPSTLTQIGEKAFYNCISLKEAIFDKESNVEFGEEVFANCARMEKLVMPEGNEVDGIPESIIYNCGNLDVGKLNGESNWVNKTILYENAVADVPIMENETQLINVVFGESFDDLVSEELATISDNGVISNVQIGKEITGSNGRQVSFTFDYQEDIRLMHMLGTFGESGGLLTCDGTDVDSNLLLVQGEDGNYPQMQKILAGKEVAGFVFAEEELLFNQVNVSESAHEITGNPIYDITFQFDVNKPIGSLAVSGSMKLDGVDIANAEVTADSIQCTEFNIVGTYENGRMEIMRLTDEYYAILIPESGYEARFFRPESYLWGKTSFKRGDDSVVAIDWNNNGIELGVDYNADKETFRKTSDEVTDLSQYDSNLAGIWSGEYSSDEKSGGMTKYIIPIGENTYASVCDFGIYGKKDGFRELEIIYYDESDRTVKCVERDLLSYPHLTHPFDIDTVVLKGALNADGTAMIGEPSEDCSYYFKLTKTGELEDLSDVL